MAFQQIPKTRRNDRNALAVHGPPRIRPQVRHHFACSANALCQIRRNLAIRDCKWPRRRFPSPEPVPLPRDDNARAKTRPCRLPVHRHPPRGNLQTMRHPSLTSPTSISHVPRGAETGPSRRGPLQPDAQIATRRRRNDRNVHNQPEDEEKTDAELVAAQPEKRAAQFRDIQAQD